MDILPERRTILKHDGYAAFAEDRGIFAYWWEGDYYDKSKKIHYQRVKLARIYKRQNDKTKIEVQKKKLIGAMKVKGIAFEEIGIPIDLVFPALRCVEMVMKQHGVPLTRMSEVMDTGIMESVSAKIEPDEEDVMMNQLIEGAKKK